MEDRKRLTREELREPDQVTTALDHAFDWVQKHPRTVAGGIAGVLALGLVVAASLSWIRSRELSAGEALGAVVEIAERPVGAASPDLQQPPRKPPFPDAAARDNAIIQEADAVLAKHGSSKAARGARMLKAQALARRGQYGEAAELYAQVAGNMPTDALGAAASFGRAEARAAAGEFDAAVEDLKRLAASGNPHVPKDLALKTAAELLAHADQAESAAKLYQRVVDEMPESTLVGECRAKAQELLRKPSSENP